jgi:hypothetical protein
VIYLDFISVAATLVLEPLGLNSRHPRHPAEWSPHFNLASANRPGVSCVTKVARNSPDVCARLAQALRV